jgi:ribose 5-phosphate isomerase B
MRISVGSDHRGFEVKDRLVELLKRLGHDVSDEGTTNQESVDYPDFACAVSRKVSSGEADRGILICGTGIGMTITANKFKGVRAAVCMDAVTAEISRRHNDLNVLCLAGDMLGKRNIDQLVETWLNTEFDGGRHARRLTKVANCESNCH